MYFIIFVNWNDSGFLCQVFSKALWIQELQVIGHGTLQPQCVISPQTSSLWVQSQLLTCLIWFSQWGLFYIITQRTTLTKILFFLLKVLRLGMVFWLGIMHFLVVLCFHWWPVILIVYILMCAHVLILILMNKSRFFLYLTVNVVCVCQMCILNLL